MNTRDKRSSAIFLASPWRGKLPVANSAVDQGDRQHAGLMYAGIAADNPAPPVPGGDRFESGMMVHMGRWMGN